MCCVGCVLLWVVSEFCHVGVSGVQLKFSVLCYLLLKFVSDASGDHNGSVLEYASCYGFILNPFCFIHVVNVSDLVAVGFHLFLLVCYLDDFSM